MEPIGIFCITFGVIATTCVIRLILLAYITKHDAEVSVFAREG